MSARKGPVRDIKKHLMLTVEEAKSYDADAIQRGMYFADWARCAFDHFRKCEKGLPE